MPGVPSCSVSARPRRLGIGVLVVAVGAALALIAPAASAALAAPAGWARAGGDEFDAAALDAKTWKPYDSVGGFGNGLRRPSAITQGNGMLTITARPRLNGGTSGGMEMTTGHLHGRWEFRARTSAGKGYSTAILLWPDSGKFPEDGELDMLEVPSEKRIAATAFVHYGKDNRAVGTSRKGDFTQWHTFAVDWLADRVTWYVDGRKAWETRDRKVIPTTPMHLCIQLDQGPVKGWMPAPDRTTPNEVRLQVDWVRYSAQR